MAKARNPNRDKAFEIWQESDGKLSNREIAAKLGEDEKKIALWKQWDKCNVVQQRKSSDGSQVMETLKVMMRRLAIQTQKAITAARQSGTKCAHYRKV